jgi:hypothetical protein
MAMADLDALAVGVTTDAPFIAGLVSEGGYADDLDGGLGGGCSVDEVMVVAALLVTMAVAVICGG